MNLPLYCFNILFLFVCIPFFVLLGANVLAKCFPDTYLFIFFNFYVGVRISLAAFLIGLVNEYVNQVFTRFYFFAHVNTNGTVFRTHVTFRILI